MPWTHEVEVLLELPQEAAVARFPPALAEFEADGERTVLRMRAESLDWVAALLANMGCDFTVRRPAELRASLRALADAAQSCSPIRRSKPAGAWMLRIRTGSTASLRKPCSTPGGTSTKVPAGAVTSSPPSTKVSSPSRM